MKTPSTILALALVGSLGMPALAAPGDDYNLETHLVHQPSEAPIRYPGARLPSDVEQNRIQMPPTRPVAGFRAVSTPVFKDPTGESWGSGGYQAWVEGGQNYVMTSTSTNYTLSIYDAASNELLHKNTFEVPTDRRHGENRTVMETMGWTIEPQTGDIIWTTYYTGRGTGTTTRVDAVTGEVRWEVNTGKLSAGGVYLAEFEGQPAVGITMRKDQGGSTFLNLETGEKIGTNDQRVGVMTRAPWLNNELVATTDDVTTVYEADGVTKLYSLPFAVRQAILLPDGNLAGFTGGRQLQIVTPEGFKVANMSTDLGAGGHFQNMNWARGFHYDADADRLQWITTEGESAVVGVSMTDLQKYIDAPQGAPWGLGTGVKFETPAKYNYFSPGETPVVTLTMAAHWAQHTPYLKATYTVTRTTDSKDRNYGDERVLELPTDPAAFAGGNAVVSLPLPETGPGVYEVDLRFTDTRTGEVKGADYKRYTVGLEGADLDPDNLPAGDDVGGVELAHRLGQDAYRSRHNIWAFYPNMGTPTLETMPTPNENIINEVKAAATLAEQYGMHYEIQLGAGHRRDILNEGPEVTSHLVEQVSRLFPEVSRWELWNEPNIYGFGDPNKYVDEVVIPFHNGLRAADPDDIIIGGSVSGNDYTGSYWRTLLDRGLPYLDQVAVHAYSGHNRSFIEQGFHRPGQEEGAPTTGHLTVIQEEIAKRGSDAKVIDTEQGFWAQGPYNVVTQGDRYITKLIGNKSIGMPATINFVNAVGYKIDGLWFSLVENGALTTGGAAGAVYGKMLAERPFDKWLETHARHTHAALHGPTSSSSDSVAAVWAEGVSDRVKLTLSGGGTPEVMDMFGGTVTVSADGVIPVDGSVSYVTVPAGQTLSVETLGATDENMLEGATATASSEWDNGSGWFARAEHVVDGITDAENRGSLWSGRNGWSSAKTDSDPSLVIDLEAPADLDSVHVVGQGIGSVETGLRGYRISFDVTGDGTYGNEQVVSNQYYERSQLVELPETLENVHSIKIDQFSINYSGYGNGNPNTGWSPTFPAQPAILEVEAFGALSETPPTDPEPPVDPEPEPTNPDVERFKGGNRYETAAAIAMENFAPGVEVLYVASGATSPDALAAAARAGGDEVPVLLTRPNGLPGATHTALKTLKPVTIVVLGGEKAVKERVVNELKTYAPTTRWAGVNRYDTAAVISQSFESADTVFLASGLDFPDALSSSAAAGSLEVPLLLTKQDGLPGVTLAELQRLQPSEVIVTGGEEAVSKDVLDAVNAAVSEWGGAAVRVAGENRYETSARLANLFEGPANPWVATGADFPDALTSAAAAASGKNPVLLTRPDSLPGAITEKLMEWKPAKISIAGGETAVFPAVEEELKNLSFE